MLDGKLASSKCLSQICRRLKFDKKTGSFTISTNTCIGRCFLWHAKQLLFVGGPGATLRIIYKLVNDHDPHGIAMMACHQHLQNSTRDSMEQKRLNLKEIAMTNHFYPWKKEVIRLIKLLLFLSLLFFFMSISRCRPFVQLSSLLEMRWRKDLDLEGFQTPLGGHLTWGSHFVRSFHLSLLASIEENGKKSVKSESKCVFV